jgi:hypothetical protein
MIQKPSHRKLCISGGSLAGDQQRRISEDPSVFRPTLAEGLALSGCLLMLYLPSTKMSRKIVLTLEKYSASFLLTIDIPPCA